MTMKQPNHGQVAAAVAACLVMLVVGLVYRILARGVWNPVNEVPIELSALERLPLQIGNWVGQDVPLDERTMRATGGDQHINRRYSRHKGSESVSLYVVLGTSAEKIMSHRPLGCYRAAGWTLIGHRSAEVPLDNRMLVPCLIYQFYREGLPAEKATVLHYCRADGRYFDEVMKVMAERWRGLRRISYAAQVQILASSEMLTDESAIQLVTEFAIDSAPSIAKLFDDIEKDHSVNESNEPRNEE